MYVFFIDVLFILSLKFINIKSFALIPFLLEVING